jgi:hypothetical protein
LQNRGEQKNQKTEKTRKKNNQKNRTKKNPIKPIKILKKPVGSVRFYKQKTEKTEPNRNRKKIEPKRSQTKKTKPKTEKTEPKSRKPSQTRKIEPNRFEPVFALKNRTELKPVGLTRFRFNFGFFLKKNLVWLFFFIKTEPNQK